MLNKAIVIEKLNRLDAAITESAPDAVKVITSAPHLTGRVACWEVKSLNDFTLYAFVRLETDAEGSAMHVAVDWPNRSPANADAARVGELRRLLAAANKAVELIMMEFTTDL